MKLNRRYRISYWIIGIMGIVLILSTFKKRYLGDNARSRIITVERLVEAGTWAHATPTDTTPFELSIDAIKVGDNIYSSKPPNYPLLMAGESLVMKGLTGMEFYEHRVDYVRMLLLVNQVLPYLVLLWIAFLFLRDFTEDRWTLNFMLLAMGVGLLSFGYATTINNHTLSATLFFIAFYLVYRITRKGDNRWWMYLLTGLLTGFAVTIELPGAVFAVIYLVLLARHNLQRTLITASAMALPLIPTLLIFYEISGNLRPFYSQGELYRYQGSYWTSPEGLDLLRESKGTYLFNILLGFKGFLIMTPVFFLSIASFIRNLRHRDGILKPEWIGIMIGVLAIILFIWQRTTNYGGECIGMRWFIVFMPLLAFMAFPLVERLGKTIFGKALCALLLLLSIPWTIEALWEDAFIQGAYQDLWRSLFGSS